MYKIYTLSTHETVLFAAHELRKYLRMMMPECGHIEIGFDPAAKEGFRLGLMQQLGLDVSDAEDPELDDILYIDTTESGGIIAGDNPRSVLLAVYEFLRQNGCRWLLPGPDGEYIPLVNIHGVQYRFAPSCRYRGWGTATAHEQAQMLAYVDFTPKLGMNLAMIEFTIPHSYYNDYYKHTRNEENRPPEPVTPDTVLQWKRQLEAEISLRGLQFHDVGHGFIADAFGVPAEEAPQGSLRVQDKVIPPENFRYVAEINGERKLFKDISVYTQFCMSSPEARTLFAQSVVRYARNHQNVDFLHVWLADGSFNHCECAACRQKKPADWYLMVMNEIDALLTSEGLDTRIVFIAYTDTMWAPDTERLCNPARFSLCFAPITRTYARTLRSAAMPPAKAVPYRRNQNQKDRPRDIDEHFVYMEEWKKVFPGSVIGFEYHSWSAHIGDINGLQLAKRVNEDVKVYKAFGVNGLIEDGSQRHFFPHGMVVYSYARTMFDHRLSYEELEEEYFKTAFGTPYREILRLLHAMAEAVPYGYSNLREAQRRPNGFYDPSMRPRIREVYGIIEALRGIIRAHYTSPIRLQTVSVRLLECYLEMTETLTRALEHKCVGEDRQAWELYRQACRTMGQKEAGLVPYYDHFHFMESYYYYFKGETTDQAKENAPAVTDAMYADGSL